MSNTAYRLIFVKEIKQSCSSARNVLQKMIKASVNGKKKLSLTRFIENIIEKWIERGRGVIITLEHAVQYSILRCFARENPKVLGKHKKPASSADDNDDDESDSDDDLAAEDDEDDIDSVNVKPGAGKDFWSLFTNYKKDLHHRFSNNMNDGQWVTFINETIAWECRTFPSNRIPILPTLIATTQPPVILEAPIQPAIQIPPMTPAHNSQAIALPFTIPAAQANVPIPASMRNLIHAN
ncbi:hypothetical protein M422DRAFT_251690 [Sphaerobolus stellatus SS14]|uniref:Uncharacterized protein n=1 Tax=Sphaerobolus stellatus (strain SS14) TaxID=990650 RepID=A0A0C9VQU2_SPHS4|nr:hypothetical protein M422DRAFT_251690 [Sphaerobolus stellatus SS14]